MDELLTRGVDEIIGVNELQKDMKSGKKLRLKLGVDPTSPDIHIGHSVILRKLKKFQDLGHTIIFLIGDVTARIGDPSGRKKTRPVLSPAEIDVNAQTYFDQVGRIIDLEKIEIRRNSEWLDKLNFNEVLQLAAKFTVAQITERDDFKNRLDEGIEVGMHELYYPLMQAYDSVMLKADIEFGGTDQRFNMLAGRSLQIKLGQRPQQVFISKLLVGLDGTQKMSKSLNNYIAITDGPADMFGKVMSLPDELIAEYYELCTGIDLSVVHELVKTLAAGANPRDSKASLAREIVRLYHSDDAATQAEAGFNSQFRDKQQPEDIEIVSIKTSGSLKAVHLLVETKLAASKSQARRLIEQGGVKLNDQVVEGDADITIKSGDIIQVGKRNFRKLKLV